MYCGITVPSHSHVAVSRTCHQLAGNANTQTCEKVGVQFTAIKWQEKQTNTETYENV